MEIIEHGKLMQNSTEKIFTCDTCDCKFKANMSEYNVIADDRLTTYYCECPECKNIAHIHTIGNWYTLKTF